MRDIRDDESRKEDCRLVDRCECPVHASEVDHRPPASVRRLVGAKLRRRLLVAFWPFERFGC